MKKSVLMFLFPGYADWEIGYVVAGIAKSQRYTLKIIGPTMSPITSMGGLNILPDTDLIPEADLADIDDDTTAMLILPGGKAWEWRLNDAAIPLIEHCLMNGIPVAAICGATIPLADLGALDDVEHTSNDRNWLMGISPPYRGEHAYQEETVVAGDRLITASGTAALEFAHAVFLRLGILGEPAVSEWFQYFAPYATIPEVF